MGRLVAVFVAFVMLAGAVQAVALNQIVNGSFEDGVVGFYHDPSDQPLPPPWNKWDARYAGHPSGNWNINVDGHDNVPSGSPPDGQHVASVCAGLNWNSGGIWQEVDVTPGLRFYMTGYFYAGNGWNSGTTVTAQFWLFNNAPTFNAFGDLITAGGVAALNYTGPRTSGWQSFNGGGITATGDKIWVVSRFNVTDAWAAYGMHMDKIELYYNPTADVPEPGSLVCLGGMLGVFGIRRRCNWRKAGIALVMIALLGAILCVPALADTSVLRNGSFSSGMSEWVVNSESGTWNALTSDYAAKLYPPVDGFSGTVLHQNLNVTGVAGKTFRYYLWLRKVNAWSGSTIAVYVTYIDTAGARHSLKILNPDNNDTAYGDWTVFDDTFTFPSDAQKLVQFSFVKEGYGKFETDGVMLLAEGVVNVAPVPVINSISSASGPYGSTLEINGYDFGVNSPSNAVTIGGSADGVLIQSWTSSRVTVLVNEPAVSGVVCVVADGVQSNLNHAYSITSPSFTVEAVDSEQRVVRGQMAEFVLDIAFRNGFNPGNGIAFSVPQAPQGAVTILPQTAKAPGGALIRVDTTNLAAGTYVWNINAVSGGTVRTIPVKLDVVNVANAWFYTVGSDGAYNAVTSLNIDKQKRIYIYCHATASDGEELPLDTPYTLTSDNYDLPVYGMPWGAYELYSLYDCTASLTAQFPDGFSKSIPVSVTMPASPRLPLLIVDPMHVSNTGAELLSFHATGSEAIYFDFDYRISGLVGYSYQWTTFNQQYTSSGRLLEATIPGTYLFHSSIRSNQEYETVIPLVVNNSSQKGMISGSIRAVKPDWSIELFGTLEMYRGDGSRAGEYIVTGWGNFVIPYLDPGAYRVRFVPSLETGLAAQWYTCMVNFTDAQTVDIAAGGSVEDIVFLLSKAAGLPPAVAYTDPPNGAVNVALDKTIIASFTEPMDVLTLTADTFRVTDSSGNPVQGTVVCEGAGATFIPTGALLSDEIYTAVITTGARDISGTPLASDYAWQFTTASNHIGSIKQMADGTAVTLSGKSLYLVRSGCGYIEEPDRACGIRIEGPIPSAEGDKVTVTGALRTSSGGERYIEIGSVTTTGMATVSPLGANIRAVKERGMDGLLITTWGRVAAGSVGPDSYSISDGSDSAGLLIKTAGAPGVTEGEYVTVSGAAGWNNGRVIYAR